MSIPFQSSLQQAVSQLLRASMGSSVPDSIPNEELDRHVAELILQEAKQKEDRYEELGLRAYLPAKLWMRWLASDHTFWRSPVQRMSHLRLINDFCPVLSKVRMNTIGHCWGFRLSLPQMPRHERTKTIVKIDYYKPEKQNLAVVNDIGGIGVPVWRKSHSISGVTTVNGKKGVGIIMI
jgi:hypothetical protein